jgi:lactate dehydrogenase-like 2-hydroxyacid dehydrogenase
MFSLARSVSRQLCVRSTSLKSSTRAFSVVSSHKRLGVVGGGQMGYGIAHVAAAQAGMDVVIYDISDAQLQRSNALSAKLLQKAVCMYGYAYPYLHAQVRIHMHINYPYTYIPHTHTHTHT